MTLDLDVAAVNAMYSQGARDGWADGKLYCQGYTLGEERFLADELADEKGLSGIAREAWDRGYCHGYRLAAEGEPLEPELAERFQ